MRAHVVFGGGERLDLSERLVALGAVRVQTRGYGLGHLRVRVDILGLVDDGLGDGDLVGGILLGLFLGAFCLLLIRDLTL